MSLLGVQQAFCLEFKHQWTSPKHVRPKHLSSPGLLVISHIRQCKYYGANYKICRLKWMTHLNTELGYQLKNMLERVRKNWVTHYSDLCATVLLRNSCFLKTYWFIGCSKLWRGVYVHKWEYFAVPFSFITTRCALFRGPSWNVWVRKGFCCRLNTDGFLFFLGKYVLGQLLCWLLRWCENVKANNSCV